jgi:tryptophan synthase beta chain
MPLPDKKGHFGIFGGKFVPETLMTPLQELERAYLDTRKDPQFQKSLSSLLKDYAGRPTPLYFAPNLTSRLKGARI